MKKEGYMLIMLMIAISVLSIGLLVAVPVWQTEIQREKEEELIFRGNEYAEAIRILLMKKPGAFPRTLDELLKEKCIRKLYKDPMTDHGEWNLILLYARVPAKKTGSAQKVMVVPYNLLNKFLWQLDLHRKPSLLDDLTFKLSRFEGAAPRSLPQRIVRPF